MLGSLCVKQPSITIDEFLADDALDRLDFVKVDVEGGELAVLDGAKQALAEHEPLVVLEFNSFGMTFHNAVLPQRALVRILETFPHVYVMDRSDGRLACLEKPKEAYELLYENGIHGPADNLLCSFHDLGVEERYSRLVSYNQDAAGLRVEAMKRTVSWRVTAPLRRTRNVSTSTLGPRRSPTGCGPSSSARPNARARRRLVRPSAASETFALPARASRGRKAMFRLGTSDLPVGTRCGDTGQSGR